MDEQIKQIAERLRGLRDVLELTAEDIARECDISAEEYRCVGEQRIYRCGHNHFGFHLKPVQCYERYKLRAELA